MAYELYYWPGIQGRGEFIRLALEDAGADYVDVCREKGTAPMMAFLDGKATTMPPFAAPFLKDGKRVIGQTANILLHLGDKIGLAPKAEPARLWTHQIQLTVTDFVVEAHDTHHPLGVDFYYEDQKPESKRRSEAFLKSRLPKFLGWFEHILELNPKGDKFLVGARATYADLSLFQILEGMRYAFPKGSAKVLKKMPRVAALHDRVADRPRLAKYLASDRRLPFNEHGIFRCYPELDG
jgi:glutathione S-transferase